MLFCIKLPNLKFYPNKTILGGGKMSYRFSRWRPLWRNFASGFGLGESLSSRGHVYQHTKFRQDNSIRGWNIPISGFEKQTSAILEIYFRFRFRPYCRNPHDILHKSAKFHWYRSTQCGNVTSYRFFKMAAAAVQYYFRFPVCWDLQKVKIY